MDTINQEFYTKMSTIAKWLAPCAFARSEKAPLDSKSVFQTYQLLINYIDDPVSGTAYPGQIVSVTADIDDTKNGAYVLLPESYEIPPETEGDEPTQGIHLRPRMLAASESIPSPTAKVFATEALANAYAATSEATIGEVVYVQETNRAYVVQAGSNNTKTTYRTATYQEVQDATATAAVYWLDGSDPAKTKVTYTSTSGRSEVEVSITGTLNSSDIPNIGDAETITIGTDVTELPYDAFSGGTSITSVTVPTTVVTFGTNPFNGCSSLTNVIFVDRTTAEAPDYSQWDSGITLTFSDGSITTP